MGPDEQKVYDLIWRRTVACQMRDAKGQRTTMTLVMPTAEHGEARFTASGKTIDFAGYRLAYIEDLEEADAELADAERVLPNLKQGDRADARELEPSGHTTQPPARISEAGLIKELEARGIGRPSTYAAIIETIVRRNYVWKKGTALVPTFTAFAVVDLLAQYLGWLVDYQFTAKMENDLDEISNGRARRNDYLKSFFLGNGTPGCASASSASKSTSTRARSARFHSVTTTPGTGRSARRPLRAVLVVRRQARTGAGRNAARRDDAGEGDRADCEVATDRRNSATIRKPG